MRPQARRAAGAALLLAALSRPADARLLGFERPGDAFSPAPGFHFAEEPATAGATVGPPATTAPLPPPRLFDTKTKIVTASVVLGAPVVGYFAWWRTSSRSSFEFANERWFQRDTYAGGADKASHIFLGYISTLTLQGIYRSLGKTPAEARGLALGVTVVTGLLIEAGDGF